MPNDPDLQREYDELEALLHKVESERRPHDEPDCESEAGSPPPDPAVLWRERMLKQLNRIADEVQQGPPRPVAPELARGVGVRMQWPHGDQYGYVVEVKTDWVRAIRYDGEELAGSRKFFTAVPDSEMPPYRPPEGVESLDAEGRTVPPELATDFVINGARWMYVLRDDYPDDYPDGWIVVGHEYKGARRITPDQAAWLARALTAPRGDQ